MRRLALALTLVAVIATWFVIAPVSAREICFPDKLEITACFDDPFSAYWETNGGLPVFGYPLTAAAPERNPDLNVDLRTQWTERNRLEVHPENQPPYDILLGRMGAERLQQAGRDPAIEGRESGPRAGCLWFETTGHNVCNQMNGIGFRSYWEGHGLKVPGLDRYGQSLQLFGLPLTSPRYETNATGDTVLTQWFERARFEWHPHNPDEFKVLLGLLGHELRSKAPLDRPASVFGVDMGQSGIEVTGPRAAEANASWVRLGMVNWSKIEPVQGTRDWSQMAAVENDIRMASERGLTPLVIVRGVPPWAQQLAGSECGPIKAEALDAFADFMRELVNRYKNPPFNVKYWEVGNEPDVDPALVKDNAVFGCWGNSADPYYGGGHYAEMLKRVYPAIKQASRSAHLVVGGLLLDCDPTTPPAGKDCSSGKFLEGILRNGGAAAFDIVAYHGYTYWNPANKDWDQEHASWKHRGGPVLGKLDFMRSVQAQYGVNKPFLLTEAGLLCYPGSENCPSDVFFKAQANYVVRLYSRAWANGLLGVTWYTLQGPGWRSGGLLDKDQQPRPAYNTFKFMSSLLRDTVYAGPLGNGSVEGYAFRKGSVTYQVYWTNSDATATVGLPAGTRALYNTAGENIPITGGSITVGFEPVFVEVANP